MTFCDLCKIDKFRLSQMNFHEIFICLFYPGHKNVILNDFFHANIKYAGAYPKCLFAFFDILKVYIYFL